MSRQNTAGCHKIQRFFFHDMQDRNKSTFLCNTGRSDSSSCTGSQSCAGPGPSQFTLMGFLPFFSLETWALLITCVCLFVTYGYWTYGVFEKLGIPGPKPVLYWGTIGRLNKVYYLADIECAQKYGRVWGLYEFRKPLMAVTDPDMLKTILVKECFSYFTNRRNLRLYGDLSDGVSLAQDDQWRRIRNTISPFFSSGHIKEMFGIMKHHSNKLVLSLQSNVHDDGVVNIKDFFGPYSIDVMGSCAFTVDVDSINNPSGPLITHASNLFKASKLLFVFQGCFPFFLPLLELLGVSLFPKSSTSYFKTFLEKVKAERNDVSSQKLKDVLQFMLNSQITKMNEPSKGRQTHGLTEHEILSQATLFVFAGYETSASTLVFLAYNLARNPEVMQRLLREIDSTFPNKAPVQYEALMRMEYLDSVVNESLRLYPPLPRLERTAKETVKINGITIPKDMVVTIPVYTLHRDPELWPEPEAFKPDRFSKENRQNINPYTYLPFGAGPRNCLGTRFALVMVKLALVEVLQNFVFSVCEDTEIPLQMDATAIISTVRPIKLKLVTRSTAPENGEETKD